MQTAVTLIIAVTLFLFIGTVGGTVYNLTPTTANWQQTIENLQAGDTANLAGIFTAAGDGYWQLNLIGQQDAPITIQGSTTQRTAFYLPTTVQNVINLSGQWIIMQNLEIYGGSKGLRLGTNPVNNSLFENLTIHDTDTTAFSANDNGVTYSNLTMRHLQIYNTGTGTGECFYLGCVGGACVIHDSFVLNNYCHNTTLANGGSQGSCIQIKPGSYNNVVQDNVCYNLRGPGILLYDDFDLGRNQIIGNLIITSQDNGIQVGAGATVVNNIIVNVQGAGIYMNEGTTSDFLSTKPYPRNLTVLQNTVVNASYTGIYFYAWNSANNFLFSNNFIYSASGNAFDPQGSSNMTGVPWFQNAYFGGSAPSGVSTGGAFTISSLYSELQDPSLTGLNFYPVGSGHLPNNGAGGQDSWPYDYNGNTRSSTSPTIGAYEYSTATNPDPVTIGFKPVTSGGGGDGDGNSGSGSGSGSSGSNSASTLHPFWL